MWCLLQNSRNFLLVNWDPLSVMMELGTPKPVDDVGEERCGLLCPELCDWVHLDPVRKLVYSDQQMSVAPWCLSQGPNDV
jgi:hypothetical protein